MEVIQDFVAGSDLSGPLGVAVSGGSDSTGLLVALNEVIGPKRLLAFTVDHRLRPESAQEARAVGALCSDLGIEHEILNWDGVKPQTRVQAAARTARQQLLGDAARRRGISTVVTAHTADDQDETRAMRALRSGDEMGPGQAGIPPATLIGGDVWFVRPLLSSRRIDIRDFLRMRDLGWVDDPSNDDARFERVRIRKAGASANPEQAGEACRLRLARAQTTERNLDLFARYAGEETFELEAGGLGSQDEAACLEALIDLAGGRARAIDRHGRKRLHEYVEGLGANRATLGRAELIRRGTRTQVRRENRDIEAVAIAPKRSVLWDGRYFIGNLDRGDLLQVRGGGMYGISPEMVRERRGEAEIYGKADGEIGGFSIKPACGRASRILPVYEIGVADALARLRGLSRFPECPWRHWLKVVQT